MSEIRHIREEIVTNKQEKDCDYVFKVITIGDAGKSLFNLLEKNLGSGKSSLLKRLTQKAFLEG